MILSRDVPLNKIRLIHLDIIGRFTASEVSSTVAPFSVHLAEGQVYLTSRTHVSGDNLSSVIDSFAADDDQAASDAGNASFLNDEKVR